MKQLLKFCFGLVFLLFTKDCLAKSIDLTPVGNQLYLATNKEIYSPSETICFQAFLINTSITISTSLFVELYDCSGNKITSKKLPLEKNMAAGSFVLPGSKNDYYLLYCYTPDKYGKAELDFIKKVTVEQGMITTGSAENKKISAQNLSVEYFFEGGNFVNELSNTVLIKTTTKDRKAISVSGKIVNEKNEVVSVFRTTEQGFISTTVVPFKNEKCTLIIKDNEGGVKSVPLPVASAEGLTFRLLTLEKSIHYVAQLFSQTHNTPLTYTLDILKDHEIVYESNLKFDDGKSQLQEEIENSNLPGGYLNIRIKDNNGKVYVERLLYNGDATVKANSIEIIDSLTSKSYTIDLPGYVSGNGCISVNAIEKSKLNFAETNAATMGNTLQTPELNNTTDLAKFNDYLISLKKSTPEVNNNGEDNTKFLTLSGTMYSAGNKPLKNKKVNILIAESKTKKQFYTSTTDEHGRVQLTNLLFFDTATVFYQLADKSDEKNNVILKLDENAGYTQQNNYRLKNYLCAGNTSEMNTPVTITVNTPAVTDTSHSKTLQEVIVKAAAKKTDKELFERKYVSPEYNFTPALDKEFDFITKPEEVLDFETVFDYIRGKIAGVNVNESEIRSRSGNSIDFTSNSNPISALQGAPVQVYIDETLFDNPITMLQQLYIKDVALIRFYSPVWRPKITGPSGGSLMIYTKKGSTATEQFGKGMPALKLTGYDNDNSEVNQLTQSASYKTLFWKPSCSITGNKIIYTNFLPETKGKIIEVKIEGINNDKIPFTFIKNITVE